MGSKVLMIGAFDTKGAEYDFLGQRIKALGASLLTVNTGVLGTTDLFPVDYEANAVTKEVGVDLEELRKNGDRGAAIKAMAEGAAQIARQLFAEGQFDGVIGMGGSGGSTVVTAAMRALPVGVPKLCVSTVAGSDTSVYVGTKDVTIMPSITDVAGINRISRIILTRAAGAIVGMVNAKPAAAEDERPIIAASMFGNTTECVDACRQSLTEGGYEVLVFHATGTGGRLMESLIDEGLVDACLDITTTEWADEVCGGVFSAGEDRLAAAGRNKIPHLIVPGCVDMANFGPIDTVPQKYRDAGRTLYEWNPAVTLMRTSAAENATMGRIFAEKANAAQGPVAFLIPLRGVSILDGDGQQFCDRQADQALFDAIRQNLREDISWVEVDANINDAAFSRKAAELMLDLIKENASRERL